MSDFSTYPTDDRLYDQPIVFTHAWESDNPGVGGGSSDVYRWGDGYVVSAEAYDDEVVHSSLVDAIRAAELHRVLETTTSIESAELTVDQIVELLEVEGDGAVLITVNGEPREVGAGPA